MNALWHGLLANLAVVALFVSLWIHTRDWMPQRLQSLRNCAFGLLMATGAIVLLQMPFELRPGFYADLRSSLVALSGFFGGPLAGVICGAAAGLFRAHMGGAGALSGCIGIVVAMLIGIAGHHLRSGRQRRNVDVLFLSIAAGPGLTLLVYSLPLPSWASVVSLAGLPVSLLNLVAILISGLALLQDDARREALRSNLLYRSVMEALPDSLNVKDLEGRFISANPATARLMRARNCEALIGRTDADFYPADIAEKFRADERQVIEDGTVQEFDQQFEHADGPNGWLWTLKAPFRNERGEIIGVITHNRDISDWKRLQDDVAQSRKHLSMALTHMADALVMFDAEDRLVFCNEQYHALFPKTAHLRVPGKTMQEILRAAIELGEASLPGGSDQWINDVCMYYKRTGNQQIKLGDGRWLDARTQPIDEGGVLIVYSDITQTKLAEETLRDLNIKLEAAARTDGLTSLLNRRAFDEKLDHDMAMSARIGRPLSLLLIDVDRFKQFNDTYGHLAGDECLRQVADCLKKTLLRTTDTAARYGGEELAAILPDTDDEGAARVAEAFLTALRNLAIPHETSEKHIVTASVGVATFVASSEPGQARELIRRSDLALYGAKIAGRDRVNVWKPRLEVVPLQRSA